MGPQGKGEMEARWELRGERGSRGESEPQKGGERSETLQFEKIL